jgi:hypothetical protein
MAFMGWCDSTPAVLAWSSETVIIPYFDPVKNCERKYFMDFRIVTKQADGSVKVTLVEIKPYKQTIKPRATYNKSDKTILTERLEYATNSAKWAAAEKFCEALGWNFVKITEKELFGGIDRGFQAPKK